MARKVMSGLERDAVEARRLDLTYGKYKALQQQGLLDDYKRRFEEEQGEKSDKKR